MVPAEEAFIITVGVPHHKKDAHCARALTVLRNYGFQAGPTSHESLKLALEQSELNRQLAENDPPEEGA